MDFDPMSIRSLIDQRAEMHPGRTFLIDPETDVVCTYEQLRTLCIQVANAVDSLGIEFGSSVAYAMPNGLGAAITILGLHYGGYRAVSINLVAGRDVIAYVLSHSETQLIITQASVSELIEEALHCETFLDFNSPKPVIALLDDVQKIQESVFTWHVQPELAPTQTFKPSELTAFNSADTAITPQHDGLLMYTSGTTGRPKGVVLSHQNLLAGGYNVCEGHELIDSDRALCVLPLFHINGLCVTLMGPLVSGSSVVMPSRFSTSKFWAWIQQAECTWFSAVPTQISYLLRDAGEPVSCSKLRFGRSASAPLSPDVHGSFEKTFGVPLIETMGLTESAAQILSNPMPPGQRKLGSPGLPVGVELRVVDAEGMDTAIGLEGELLIRGKNIMQRYFRNPEATKAAVMDGGWLRTGDLGKLDNEGYVFITGRLKELIIKGGENIAPREIDDALYSHPDVVEAAAFAVECTNYGQRVEAAVCLKPGSTLSTSELLGLVQTAVGAFKCPDKIYLLDELPKGPSGKIQRNKLCDMALV